MNQYNINVTKVMEFLVGNNYSASSKSLHKTCYESFKSYLKYNKLKYSFENAKEWIENNHNNWNYRRYTGYKHCLDQLEDIFKNGQISLSHISPQVSDYSLLCNILKGEINEYLAYELNSGVSKSDIPRCRIACSRFMIYLQKHKIISIHEVSYDIIISFYKEDYHRTYKSKDIYNNKIRAMLFYFASARKCSIGHALILNKLVIHQVICDSSFLPNSVCNLKITPDFGLWTKVNLFLDKLKEISYKDTVIKTSKHTLTLLYIFLDMYNLNFTDKTSWLWFNKVKPHLKSNWKQARRTLNQFIYFMKNGSIITEVTGDGNVKSNIDLLPIWCQKPLNDFLILKQKEGMAKSTLDMYISSVIRFCRFIVEQDIENFNAITPVLIQHFNTQDIHSTTEGKSAYNSRIRNFLIFLNDQKLIDNCFLYKVLPTITAPKNRIISVLNNEEIIAIKSFHLDHIAPIELRDNAILMIGLNLGLRASDIVSLKFSDINWTKRNINLLQQKTQKDITLPLPVSVGNAIYNYIKNGRPKHNCPYVFINHSAPYGKLTTTVCRRALQRALPHRKTGGFHIVRKTFATNLLRSNSKISLISEALGHKTNSTVNKYLSLDEERMQMCPLSLDDANIHWIGSDF